MKGTLHNIPARKLRVGDTMIDFATKQPLEVKRIAGCHDGALRVIHGLGESRMTPSVTVQVMH